MKPSCSAISVLILIIFIYSVQGIRLEKSSKATLMEACKGLKGEVIVCKEGKYCTGMCRKLFTAITSTGLTSTTTSKSQENGENKANSSSKVEAVAKEEINGEKQEKLSVGSPTSSEHQEVHDQYADIMDIAEMDYSPVKRKPPIHN